MNLARTKLGEAVLKQAIGYLMGDPQKNIPKIINWTEKICTREEDKSMVNAVKNIIGNPDSLWYEYACDVINKTNSNIREKTAVNFFLNSVLLSQKDKVELEKKYDCCIPWAILMDLTSACNLRCTGCWAGKYELMNLDYEVIDRIITEGKQLGIYMYILSGGEPLVRKNDIIKLCAKHNDCQFLAFTNGTLVDEELAAKMQEVGNFALAFSVEGSEEETDMRRGKGTFQAVMKGMDIVKKAGCIYGFSACYHRKNIDTVASDEFIDLMIEKGARFGWYFTYIPVGRDSDVDFMATPEQRKYMYKRVNYLRGHKGIFVLDFWNDGEYVKGCVAGGKNYFHINANGDCEPCAFIHYSNVNIKDHSLIEALQSPLFRNYQSKQPFNNNHLRPCPLIDNPDALRNMVKESNAKSTQIDGSETVDELADKLQEYSKAWGEISEQLWAQADHGRF